MKRILLTIIGVLAFATPAHAGELAQPGIVITRDGKTWVTKGDEWVTRSSGMSTSGPFERESFDSPTGMYASRIRWSGGPWKGSVVDRTRPWGLRAHVEVIGPSDWCRYFRLGYSWVWKIKPYDSDGVSDCYRDALVAARVARGYRVAGYSCRRSTVVIRCSNGSNNVVATRSTISEIIEQNVNRTNEVSYCGSIQAITGGATLTAHKDRPFDCEAFSRQAGAPMLGYQNVYGVWGLAPVGWSCADRGMFFECRSNSNYAACVTMKKPTIANYEVADRDVDERGIFFYSLVNSC